MRYFLLTLCTVLGLVLSGPASAQEAQQNLVNNATASIENFLRDPNFATNMHTQLQRAKAVMVIPSLWKAGFFLGGATGEGVLLVRQSDGSWSYPAFYNMHAGSLGLQFGVQNAEVVLVIMTDSGLESIREDQFKLGVDASVTFMTVGGGINAATTTSLSDIYAYSKSVGFFGGGALEGAVIKPDADSNIVYYGRGATTAAILFDGGFTEPGADVLRQKLAEAPAAANSNARDVADENQQNQAPVVYKDSAPQDLTNDALEPASGTRSSVESAPLNAPASGGAVETAPLNTP